MFWASYIHRCICISAKFLNNALIQFDGRSAGKPRRRVSVCREARARGPRRQADSALRMATTRRPTAPSAAPAGMYVRTRAHRSACAAGVSTEHSAACRGSARRRSERAERMQRQCCRQAAKACRGAGRAGGQGCACAVLCWPGKKLASERSCIEYEAPRAHTRGAVW
jgi:hypothetical protein